MCYFVPGHKNARSLFESMPNSEMTDTLWDFSVATYRRPGVQEACLALQDGMDADVNILMYCCWRGRLKREEFELLLAALAPWQYTVVRGLRSVRRALKPMLAELDEFSADAGGLRKKVAALELEAEKLQQAMLGRHAADHAAGPPSPRSAADNLACYFTCLAKAPDGEAQKALKILIGAAFPDDGEEAIEAAIATLK